MEHATMGCTAGSFMDINIRNVLMKKKKNNKGDSLACSAISTEE